MAHETLHILLGEHSLKRAREGRYNFFDRLTEVMNGIGWAVHLQGKGDEDRVRAEERGGPTLVHMTAPTHEGALTCRHAYIGAFWRIEQTHERWAWPIAKAAYDPGEIDSEAATLFYENWRNWHYQGGGGVGDDGFVLVPLQGKLLKHRSFQSMSPIKMLREVLGRVDLPVLATLHPKEHYNDAEMAALAVLQTEFPRLEIATNPPAQILRRCSYVITQNSSLAFHGMFFGKKAILFGEIEFHHIAGSVPRDGIDAAFASLEQEPDFARYLTWFFTRDIINAGSECFDEQLLACLRKHGWKL